MNELEHRTTLLAAAARCSARALRGAPLARCALGRREAAGPVGRLLIGIESGELPFDRVEFLIDRRLARQCILAGLVESSTLFLDEIRECRLSCHLYPSCE